MIQINNLPEMYNGTVVLLEKDVETDSLDLKTLCEKLIAKREKLRNGLKKNESMRKNIPVKRFKRVRFEQ